MQGRPAADEALDRKVAERAVTLLAHDRALRPLTSGFMHAVAKQAFGHNVGLKRASRMVAHLRSTGSLIPAARYRGHPHGFWVTVYRLRPKGSSVGRKGKVKNRKWWEHSLFGNPDREIPLGASEERLERWKSKPWFWAEVKRATS